MNKFLKFVQEEEGATAVEYAIMVGLIAAVIVSAVTLLGTSVSSKFDNFAQQPFWK